MMTRDLWQQPIAAGDLRSYILAVSSRLYRVNLLARLNTKYKLTPLYLPTTRMVRQINWRGLSVCVCEQRNPWSSSNA